jgi:hypothetical protein
MPKHYWFRPKALGYGATPISWQGWALTTGFALLISAAIVVALRAETQRWLDRCRWQAVSVVVAAVAFAVLIVIARATTDGERRWRR